MPIILGPSQVVTRLLLFGTLIVYGLPSSLFILLTTSLVYLQQLLITCVSTHQLTINFHNKIVNLIVLCNTFIQPSNATIGLLLATDLREGILGNLQHRLQGDVSLEMGICVGVLPIIHTKYYLLAAALLPPNISVLTSILQDVSIR